MRGNEIFLKSPADYIHRLALSDVHIPELGTSKGNRITLIGFLIEIYPESYGEDGHLNRFGATPGKGESE